MKFSIKLREFSVSILGISKGKKIIFEKKNFLNWIQRGRLAYVQEYCQKIFIK